MLGRLAARKRTSATNARQLFAPRGKLRPSRGRRTGHFLLGQIRAARQVRRARAGLGLFAERRREEQTERARGRQVRHLLSLVSRGRVAPLRNWPERRAGVRRRDWSVCSRTGKQTGQSQFALSGARALPIAQPVNLQLATCKAAARFLRTASGARSHKARTMAPNCCRVC